MTDDPARHDVVVFGATGFTGKLVAEHLRDHYGCGAELDWAIAGRDRAKLEAVRAELGLDRLPMLVADASDPPSLERLARSARVVCTTVGPYALYGSGLVEACAGAGTDYCDLTGEVPWMRRMIDAHHRAAVGSGARIVHCCGFDSIPSDLGVLFVQRARIARHGAPAPRVKGRVAGLRGAASGGTVASMMHMLEEAGRDREVRRLLADPDALTPSDGARRGGPPDQTSARWDADFGRWTVPFVMAAINTRVVRRSHALMGRPWGEGFRYDEAMLAPPGHGALRAHASATAMAAGMVSLALPPVRAIARRLLPSPGEGPDPQARERGFFDLRFLASDPDDRAGDVGAVVTGDRDPGYGSTSRMLGEAAVCLARDGLDVGGGFWTPATAMGERLIERLEARAGLSFEAVEDPTAERRGGPRRAVSAARADR